MTSQHIVRYEVNGQARQAELSPNFPLVVGTAPSCNIILDDGMVMPRHLEISYDATQDAVVVTDLATPGGTYINGQPLVPNEATPWQPGATLELGNSQLQVERVETASSYSAPASPSPVTPAATTGAGGFLQVSLAAETLRPNKPTEVNVVYEGSGQPTIYLNAVIEGDALQAELDPPQVVASSGVPQVATVTVRRVRRVWSGGRFRLRVTGVTANREFDTAEAMVRVSPSYLLLLLFLIPLIGLMVYVAAPPAPTPPPTPTPTATFASTFTPEPPTLTPSPSPTPPCPNGGEDLVHTVQSGQILSRIAVQYSVTVPELMAANNLTNPDTLSTGQQLQIPCGIRGFYPQPPTPPQTSIEPFTGDPCAVFRLTSPLIGLTQTTNVFYWDPAPGATAYDFTLNRGGSVVFSQRILAPRTSVVVSSVTLDRGVTYFWTVTPIQNSSTLCSTATSSSLPVDWVHGAGG